jgi:hypothetical protein
MINCPHALVHVVTNSYNGSLFFAPKLREPPLRLRQLGTTLQTAFRARWYGTRRGLGAPLRRRPRCLSWDRLRPRGRVWLLVSLYTFVMPPKRLRQGRKVRTPARARGLTAHVWS